MIHRWLLRGIKNGKKKWSGIRKSFLKNTLKKWQKKFGSLEAICKEMRRLCTEHQLCVYTFKSGLDVSETTSYLIKTTQNTLFSIYFKLKLECRKNQFTSSSWLLLFLSSWSLGVYIFLTVLKQTGWVGTDWERDTQNNKATQAYREIIIYSDPHYLLNNAQVFFFLHFTKLSNNKKKILRLDADMQSKQQGEKKKRGRNKTRQRL